MAEKTEGETKKETREESGLMGIFERRSEKFSQREREDGEMDPY